MQIAVLTLNIPNLEHTNKCTAYLYYKKSLNLLSSSITITAFFLSWHISNKLNLVTEIKEFFFINPSQLYTIKNIRVHNNKIVLF